MSSVAEGSGKKAYAYSAVKRQKRNAIMFCISKVVAWLCIDLMHLCHEGIGAALNFTKSKIGFFLSISRWCLMVFVGTLWLWTIHPELLTVIGMFTLFVEVVISFSWKYYIDLAKVKSEREENQEALVV